MNISPILDSMETFRSLNEEKGRTIDRLNTTIKNLKTVMIENDISCEECGGSLSNDELEYGICTDCSRFLS